MSPSNIKRTFIAALSVFAGCSPGSATGEGTTGAASSFESTGGSLSSGTTSSVSLESTAETSEVDSTGSVCGDHQVDPGEQCDGEPIYGVVCPAACVFQPGEVLWSTIFDVAAGNDRVTELDVDARGILLVGEAGVPDVGSTALLALVGDDGVLVWSRQFDADPRNAGQHSASGGFWLDETFVATGNSFRSPWVGRFDVEGEVLWSQVFEGSDPQESYLSGSVDELGTGRIVVIGSADLAYEAPGFLLVYDEELGEMLESQWFGGPTYVDDMSDFAGIRGVVDGDGDIVVSGAAFLPEGSAGWLHRRTTAGETAWSVTVPTHPSGAFTRPAIAADGSIAVAMGYPGARSDVDIWVGLYSPGGELEWSTMWAGPYGREDFPAAVARDLDGGVLVHGTVSNDVGAVQAMFDYDMVLLSYSRDGESRWQTTYSGPGTGDGLRSWDYAGALTVDQRGFVVAAGQTISPAGDYDVLVQMVAP